MRKTWVSTFDLMASDGALTAAAEPAVLPSSSPSLQRRAVCGHFARPASVCLCAWLPPQPIDTAGAVVVLQHPNEAKRRLGTVALLRRCLSRFLLLRGRKVSGSAAAVQRVVPANWRAHTASLGVEHQLSSGNGEGKPSRCTAAPPLAGSKPFLHFKPLSASP